MRRFLLLAALPGLLLAAACDRSDNFNMGPGEELMAFKVQEEPPRAMDVQADRPAVARATVPPSAPQIAYTYNFAYRIGNRALPAVQQRHIALCDALGPARCRIVRMTRDSGEGAFVAANLSLQVDSRLARRFGDRLDEAVTGSGGSVTSRGIEAEDLSRQIVDTAARVRGKEALAQRLLVLLQNRTGAVGELVQAERAYAETQEELDAARTWLAQMRRRVAMSGIEISYNGDTPVGGGLWQPVRDSFAGAGQVLGRSIAALVSISLLALPWLIALWLLVRIARWLGWKGMSLRWPRWRRRGQSLSRAAGRADRASG
jgi:hypothetical protein